MYCHPKDTCEIFRTTNKEKIAHLAYHMNFFVLIDETRNEKYKENKGKKYKAKQIEHRHTIHHELKQLAKRVESKRSYALASLGNNVFVCQLEGKIESRMLIGLGTGHVRETALTIHPVYGIPYVPASSLKGLVRNWFIHAYCNGDERDFINHPLGTAVFGTNQERGLVQFYDIFLYHGLQIEGDIMAVHYPNYYNGQLSATDDQRINPIHFWTAKVEKVNIFLSMIKTQMNKELNEREILNAASSWTAKALMEFGVGSKTSLGYGIFSEVKDVTDTEFMKIVKERKEVVEKENEQKKKIEISHMPPEEQLLYYIDQLTDSAEDIENSKSTLFEQVIDLQSKKAAQALKSYWQRTNQWKVKKGKKQFIKVCKINDLLNK